MAYQILLYHSDLAHPAGSYEHFCRMLRLKVAGHPVKEENKDVHLFDALGKAYLIPDKLIQAWIEFETEDEAALFKLTYL